MSKHLEIELGDEEVVGHCDTCGHETRTFRGFVYDQEGAYAIYLCTYTASHPESGVEMAVSIDGWGTGADPALKECVALEWYQGEAGPGCRVLDAPDSPWASHAILGRMLPRDQAMNAGKASEAFAISDAVWLNDQRLSAALNKACAVCESCGEIHTDEMLELTFKRPDAVAGMTVEERAEHVQETDDICIIQGKRFFLRATLPLPVLDRPEAYRIGIWVEIAQADFERVYECWDDPKQSEEPLFSVMLANHIQTLPETLGLRAELRLIDPQTRPEVYAGVSDHPLKQEQSTGITPHRAHEYTSSITRTCN
ncbi:DUF2199 domain-containing protein [Pseudomonas sp. NPDC089734]|uniref:DUF2199 domain-containing protein n=1 Tax=Pseudomonas sp. NPDC089734 TaxID=3364469 RepID=UPI00380543EA